MLPSGFSGFGMLSLVTNSSGLDRYLELKDNVGHVFFNHQFTNTGQMSG